MMNTSYSLMSICALLNANNIAVTRHVSDLEM